MCPARCRALTRTCSVALEAQLGALWWPRWLGWGWGCEGGQRGEGGYFYTYNWLIHCIAETNTILESNYTQIKFFSDLLFILYPADFPDSMMSSHTLLISVFGFFVYLQTVTILCSCSSLVISFSFPIAVTRMSRTVLNKSGESKHQEVLEEMFWVFHLWECFM